MLECYLHPNRTITLVAFLGCEQQKKCYFLPFRQALLSASEFLSSLTHNHTDTVDIFCLYSTVHMCIRISWNFGVSCCFLSLLPSADSKTPLKPGEPCRQNHCFWSLDTSSWEWMHTPFTNLGGWRPIIPTYFDVKTRGTEWTNPFPDRESALHWATLWSLGRVVLGCALKEQVATDLYLIEDNSSRASLPNVACAQKQVHPRVFTSSAMQFSTSAADCGGPWGGGI